MAELLLGLPLFPGESGVDQLVEIIKVGAPALAGCCLEKHGTNMRSALLFRFLWWSGGASTAQTMLQP
jgi:hypothetical protein